MYLSNEVAKVATNNGFSLFGMGTSDSINMVIAIIAILGFIASLIISIFTLRQTKNMHLFSERREVLIALFDFTYMDEPTKEDCYDFQDDIEKVPFLFKRCGEVFDSCLSLSHYYLHDEQLPDYTKRYKKSLLKAGYEDNDITVEEAFLLHCRIEIGKLSKNILNLNRLVIR